MKIKWFQSGSLFCSLLFSLTLPARAFSGEMEEMQRDSAVEMNAFLHDAATELQTFRTASDREFAQSLAQGWQAMEEMAGLIADPVPKPGTPPRAPDRATDEVKAGEKLVVLLPPPEPAPLPLLSTPAAPAGEPAPPLPSPAPPRAKTASAPLADQPLSPALAPLSDDDLRLRFFGAAIAVNVPEPLRLRLPRPCTERALLSAWSALAAADDAGLLRRLGELRQELQLNDWGYYQLVDQVAGAAVSDESGATLLSWFVLVKSGYRCRIGFSGDELSLLVAAKETIFATPYVTIADERFYDLTYLAKKRERAGTLVLHTKDHPEALQRFELQLRHPPLLPAAWVERQLDFTYAGISHRLPARYNRNVTEFYAGYPQTDFPVFFAAGIDPQDAEILLAGLRPLLAGKTESEAVNLLLRFVQTAFAYQTDDEQFGREKYFFPAETLAYPFSDCEDRAILFTYLVKKLTGLPVVGLHYPGHMAAAVRFSTEVSGAALVIDGHTYTICDPTYINADIGEPMPQFAKSTPVVVAVEL